MSAANTLPPSFHTWARIASCTVSNRARRLRDGIRIPSASPSRTDLGAALFSVGLADDITTPSTVFAAFNHYAGPKDIAAYEFNGHEGGGTHHLRAKLDFLAATLAAPSGQAALAGPAG